MIQLFGLCCYGYFRQSNAPKPRGSNLHPAVLQCCGELFLVSISSLCQCLTTLLFFPTSLREIHLQLASRLKVNFYYARQPWRHHVQVQPPPLPPPPPPRINNPTCDPNHHQPPILSSPPNSQPLITVVPQEPPLRRRPALPSQPAPLAQPISSTLSNKTATSISPLFLTLSNSLLSVPPQFTSPRSPAPGLGLIFGPSLNSSRPGPPRPHPIPPAGSGGYSISSIRTCLAARNLPSCISAMQ